MKRVVQFETVSDAKYIDVIIRENILSFTRDLYGYNAETALYFSREFEALDLQQFYVVNSRNQRITNIIKKLLKPYVPATLLDSKFSIFASRVASLYNNAQQLTAYFADKSTIGQYGDEDSCFRNNGSNASNGEFMRRFNRVRLLVIDSSSGGVGRCYVYFAGGRTIYLTNFYFLGLTENTQFFIQGIRKLIGQAKITYTEVGRNIPLPIYLNDDGYKITTGKSFSWPFPRILPCPKCTNKVQEDLFYQNVSGNVYEIGCCENCAGTRCNICGEPEDDCDCVTCRSCEERIHPNDVWRAEDNDYVYCEDCFKLEHTQCHDCNDWYRNEALTNRLCESCLEDYSNCDECGESTHKDNRQDFEDGRYCQDCYDQLVATCSECGEHYLKRDMIGDSCDSCQETEIANAE